MLQGEFDPDIEMLFVNGLSVVAVPSIFQEPITFVWVSTSIMWIFFDKGIRDGDEEIDVVVKYKEDKRSSLQHLQDLNIISHSNLLSSGISGLLSCNVSRYSNITSLSK